MYLMRIMGGESYTRMTWSDTDTPQCNNRTNHYKSGYHIFIHQYNDILTLGLYYHNVYTSFLEARISIE